MDKVWVNVKPGECHDRAQRASFAWQRQQATGRNDIRVGGESTDAVGDTVMAEVEDSEEVLQV